eukprot:EG_transcript_14000
MSALPLAPIAPRRSPSAAPAALLLLVAGTAVAGCLLATGAEPRGLFVASTHSAVRTAVPRPRLASGHPRPPSAVPHTPAGDGRPAATRPDLSAQPTLSGADAQTTLWSRVAMLLLGFAGLVWGARHLIAVFPLSGLRGTMEPFLDSIDDDDTFLAAERLTQQMEKAETAGDLQELQHAKAMMAATMEMVSFEAVKRAVRVQVACGTITVHSLIDNILVHAVPPLPSADGVVDFTVEDVALGRFWRRPDLWQVAPLLKNLHDCEAELQVDLGDVLMGLLQRYTGCVSYVSLENPTDILTETEQKAVKFLARACFGIEVPYRPQ